MESGNIIDNKVGISSRKVGKYYDETGKSKKIYGDSGSV